MQKLNAQGLRALIPIKPKTRPKKRKDSVYYVEIRKIRLTPHLRASEGRAPDRKVMKELVESIKKYGVVQPLELVKVERKKSKGINVYYKLVSGRKRLAAAKTAGLRVVPAKIKTEK